MSNSKQSDEDAFDELPSLFPAEHSKNVKIFTVKSWQKPRNIIKKIGKELRENSFAIVRGFDDQTEKCIICTEMAKDFLAEAPKRDGNDCTTVYQWNKIGQIKIKPDNNLELDKFVPVLEIFLSCKPFKVDQLDDSMQESNAIELAPTKFKRSDTSFKFLPLKRQNPEPIGEENPDNIFRKKRKQ